MVAAGATVSRKDLADYCRAHDIRRLAVFGSRLRGDARAEEDLSRMFGLTVDLNTPGWLCPLFRETVLREAEDLYVGRYRHME